MTSPTTQIPVFAAKTVKIDPWSPDPKNAPPTQLHIRLESIVFNRAIYILFPLRSASALDRLIARLQHARALIWGEVETIAHLKPGWKMPMAPAGACPYCKKRVIPCAVHTGDGWAQYWDCESGCEPFADSPGGGMIEGESAWPFVEDWVKGSDWERIGFKVG
jgi:hypothetical protein